MRFRGIKGREQVIRLQIMAPFEVQGIGSNHAAVYTVVLFHSLCQTIWPSLSGLSRRSLTPTKNNMEHVGGVV